MGGTLAALLRSNYVSLSADQIMTIRKDGQVQGFNTNWEHLKKKTKTDGEPQVLGEDLSIKEDMLR